MRLLLNRAFVVEEMLVVLAAGEVTQPGCRERFTSVLLLFVR